MTSIEITFLKKYPSLELALIDLLQISQNKLKKYLNKKKRSQNVLEKKTFSLPLNIINHHSINPQYLGKIPQIIYEDSHFIVLDKPSNIHSHPLEYGDSHNCLSFLRSIGKGKLLDTNTSTQERGLINRLDFETSGVLCYTKSLENHKDFRRHFSTFVKEKIYYAQVNSLFICEGKMTHYLTPSGPRGKKMIISPNKQPNSLEAQAIFQRFQYCSQKNMSSVKIELISGVRHQIRAQLAFLGFPIRGDSLYGGSPAQRLYLHAHCYEIQTTEKNYKFIAPTPPCFDIKT